VFGSTDVTGPAAAQNWRVEWESEGGAVSEAEAMHAEAEVFDRPGAMRLELADWTAWAKAVTSVYAKVDSGIAQITYPVKFVKRFTRPAQGESSGSGWSGKAHSDY
jgi:hypothetical protein